MAISENVFYGDSNFISLTANTMLILGLGRLKVILPDAAGRKVMLPLANELPINKGGPVFFLLNTHATESVAVYDRNGSLVHTLAARSACKVGLLENNTVQGMWGFICGELKTGETGTTTLTTPPPFTLTHTGTNTGISATSGDGYLEYRNPLSLRFVPFTTLPPSVPATCTTAPTKGQAAVQVGKEEWINEFRLYGPRAQCVKKDLDPYRMGVIITALNEGPDLEQTIDTLLAADRRPDQILVMDDCSLEPVAPRLMKYMGTGVAVHRSPTSLGCAPSRHLGAQLLRPDINVITFLDGHMGMPRQWLTRMLGHIHNHPRALFCPISSDFDGGFWGTGAELNFNNSTGHWKADWASADMSTPSPLIPAVMGACYTLKRDVLETIGGWAPGLRGWGLDEEYIAARLYAMGYECRLASDFDVKHRYTRPNLTRATADGVTDAERTWEVLYNHVVLVRTLLPKSVHRKYEQCITAPWPDLRAGVEQRLYENRKEIAEAHAFLEKHRTLGPFELMAELADVRRKTFMDPLVLLKNALAA